MCIYSSFSYFSGDLSCLIWNIILCIFILINFLWCGFCSDGCRIIYFVASFVHPLMDEAMMRLLFVSIPLHHNWSTEKKNRILSLKLWFNKKIYNHFLKSRYTLELAWKFFWKLQMSRYCFFSLQNSICDSNEQSFCKNNWMI